MQVSIFTIKKGLEQIEDVISIRIKSKLYNLLVLKDYLPIIGKIEGNFEIETKNDKIKYENVTAYYVNNKNKFNIIIEGE